MRSPALRLVRANSGLTFRPDASCVLWLPGQDDPQSSTIRDRSGKGNHGTISGATWVRLPSGLWCLSFDGTDDSVDCGAGASLNITEALTVEGWVKPIGLSIDGPSYPNYIVCKGEDRYMIQAAGYDGAQARFYMWGVGVDIYTVSTLSYGNWYHIVATYDRVKAKIYLNGVFEKSVDATASITTDAGPLIIGDWMSHNNHFNGLIDEVRIYNRALTPAEIQSFYNETKGRYN